MIRRAASLVAVLAAVLVVAIVAITLGADEADDREVDVTEVESDSYAMSVADAFNRSEPEAFAVRGYVYDDGAFLHLCNGLTREMPPRCGGISLLLKNLDLARLPLEQDEIDGRTIYYTAEPVVLAGRVDGAQLVVTDVLNVAPAEE